MNKALLVGSMVCLSVALSACEKKSDTAVGTPAGETTIVKLGSVAPLTGPQAHLGKDNDNGVRLAVEEVNATGLTIGGKKVKFEVISEDDQADPKTATIVAQRLVDAQVKAVIGHLNSGTTIPASKIYFDAGIPQVSPSATAIAYTAQKFNTAYRVMTNDSQQGRVLGNFAAKQAKKIAIIDDRTAYGQGLADEFEKAAKAGGAEIVGREYTTHTSTDFLSILTAAKAKNPELLFYGGMDAQAAPMIKQLKQLGIKAQFLGGDGAQSAEFIKLAGPQAEGAIASSPGLPITEMPGGKAFADKFTSKYGKIQIYAPYAYDATFAVINAMKAADSTEPSKYLPELAKTNFAGVTGPISFDEKGDVKGEAVTLYKVTSGQWQPIK